VVETFYTTVESDQEIPGSSLNAANAAGTNYVQTPIPATLTVTLEAGTYLLTWHSELMRTNLSSNPFFARLREVDGPTYGFLRQRSSVENGASGDIPDDTNLNAAGDVIPISGSAVLSLPDGTRTYRLEYAMVNAANTPSFLLRVQHQRISVLRLE